MGPLAASAYLRVWRSPVRVQVGIGQSLSVCVAATGAGVTQIHGFSGDIFREDLGCWGHQRLRCACVERCRHQWLVKVVKLALVCRTRTDMTEKFLEGEIHERQAWQMSYLFAISKPTVRKSASSPKIQVFPRTFKTIPLLNRFALRVR